MTYETERSLNAFHAAFA